MALIYEDLIPTQERKAFVDKVRRISDDLEINPNWLMGVMNFESGLNPKARNNNTRATGLIQFIPSTAVDLGTTVDDLYNMSRLQQLDYVYKYYNQQWIRPKLTQYTDLYLATIFPRAMGKPDSYVIENEPKMSKEKFTSQNPIFDRNGNNNKATTVGEIKAEKMKRIPQEWREQFGQNMDSVSKKFQRYYGVQVLLIALFVISIGAIVWLKRKSLF